MNTNYFNTETGISYTLVGDYYLPDLAATPAENEEKPLGKYGKMRLEYLKNHRKVLYLNLLTSGKLSDHLQDVEERVTAQIEKLVVQMAAKNGVDERLKERDQMRWVRLMNNCKACAEEVVRVEIEG